MCHTTCTVDTHRSSVRCRLHVCRYEIIAGSDGWLMLQGFEGVQTCKKNETLQAVMEKIVKAEVHCICVMILILESCTASVMPLPAEF